MHKTFSVLCSCGHPNRPHPSPREGIRRVLSGEFAACRQCGSKFSKVEVPNRPLVEAVRSQITETAPHVEICAYQGRVPMARGIV